MVENLTMESFKEKVFDYTKNDKWVFSGTKPAIIDFYADWCAPCKAIAPVFEELSVEYPDIDFYKINTENEQELAMTFEIRSIPSFLFIPVDGEPQMAMGALPKESFIEAIRQIFKTE